MRTQAQVAALTCLCLNTSLEHVHHSLIRWQLQTETGPVAFPHNVGIVLCVVNTTDDCVIQRQTLHLSCCLSVHQAQTYWKCYMGLIWRHLVLLVSSQIFHWLYCVSASLCVCSANVQDNVSGRETNRMTEQPTWIEINWSWYLCSLFNLCAMNTADGWQIKGKINIKCLSRVLGPLKIRAGYRYWIL